MQKSLLLMTLLLLAACTKNWTYDLGPQHGMRKYCFLGDTGTGSESQRRTAMALEKEGCHAIHFLGDLIYPKGIEAPDDPLLKERFLDHYVTGPRLFLVMGNHDHRGQVRPWKEIAQKHPAVFFPNQFYLIKQGGLCLTHLDTNLLKVVILYPKAIAQWVWLSGLHEELEGCDVKVAVTHHPYRNSGDHHGPATGAVKWFLEANIIGEYDFLMSGHEHAMSDEGTQEGTRMLISGGGGSPYDLKDAGYMVLEVEFDQGKVKSVSPRTVRTHR